MGHMTGLVWPQRNISIAGTVQSREGVKAINTLTSLLLFPSLTSTASASTWLDPARARQQGTLGYILCRDQPPGKRSRAKKDRR